MRPPSEEWLAATAAEAAPLRRLRAFTAWVGAGRKLTQTGRITLAGARELVGLLGTEDEIDPKIGDRVFRDRGIRAGRCDRPAAGHLAGGERPRRAARARHAPAVGRGTRRRRGLGGADRACAVGAWPPSGRAGAGRPGLRGEDHPGRVDDPPVWRRLLVPAGIRLDRFHQVIQAVMGWEGYHMHVFSDGRAEYGRPDPELKFRDERKATLRDLIPHEGGQARYTYDFGDDWEHDVVVEKLLAAEPGMGYPVCVAGAGACPPEDCGGVWGYAHLREVLADPADEEHDDMLAWLGLDKAGDFDPYGFDVDKANRALTVVGAAR